MDSGSKAHYKALREFFQGKLRGGYVNGEEIEFLLKMSFWEGFEEGKESGKNEGYTEAVSDYMPRE